MAKRGPKGVQINWEEFDKLCMIQCTLEEIAHWFNCSVDTIENVVKRMHRMKFSEYFALKRSKGKVSLRRKQFQLAMDGSIPMNIWLGKQHLGQTDKAETNNKNVEMSYEDYINNLDKEGK